MIAALGIDWSDVKRVMANLKAAEDQMPFAMSLALNEATRKARQHLVSNTWAPPRIQVRNASFIRAALRIKDKGATKRSLETEIYDSLGRGHLYSHAKGGVRTARAGRAHMTVPTSRVPKSGRGVPQRLRPRVLGEKLFKQKGNPDALFVRDSRGRLQLMYVLKTATPIPKRVPFFEDYHAVMSRELRRAIPIAVERAMRTRRVR